MKTPFLKFLLVAEFALAFWIPVVAMAFGLFGTQMAIASMFSGSFSSLFIPLLTIGGAMGFWGISKLLAASLTTDITLPPKGRLIFYLVCGCFAAIPLPYLFFSNSVLFSVFSVLPFIVTVQLVILHRGYFAG
ncbi:hypothetical protein QTP81_16935 [Alteromonas sp. ASW11-36]|uniref:Uncharacterized protein n=1 Tax=Alteromonas arenosi TaxID=3055817 RepID=A0ABT7T1H6_9ALTE|nr:hypothetical protein [Alteromonas sp. ASW11-36]MDM7862295.1 hypothetical protein [Alteromonas sp. ASW11-36]